MSTAVSFRYDFLENEPDEMVPEIIRRHLREFYPGTLGIESRNKYGEQIKRHFHYNFYYPANDSETKKWVERIRKAIQRENNAKEENKRGKGYYSLTVQDVRDRDRWLRYPYKQYEHWSDIPLIPEIGPPGEPGEFDIFMQWQLANEEYKRDLDFLTAKRERADRRETVYERILAEIEAEKLKFTSEKGIYQFLIEFHRRERLPVNRGKLNDLIDSIALEQGILSLDDYYDLVRGGRR